MKLHKAIEKKADFESNSPTPFVDYQQAPHIETYENGHLHAHTLKNNKDYPHFNLSTNKIDQNSFNNQYKHGKRRCW